MPRFRVLAVALLALASTACVTSDQSFVPPQTATVAPELLGTWTDSAGKERALITRASRSTYTVVYTDDGGETWRYTGRLAVVGRWRVLDLESRDEPARGDTLGGRHVPIILEGRGSRLHVSILERDSLDAYLARHADAPASRRRKDETVLTASTPELWKFLEAYLANPGVLGERSTWIRRGR